MLRALLIIMALIGYLCLYPFHFHPFPPEPLRVFWHSWPAALDRPTGRDAVVNLLLYLPLGIFAFLALDQVRSILVRLLAAIFLGTVLSTCIELVQLMDTTRTSSTFDVACNAAGTALGALIGGFYARPVSNLLERAGHGLRNAPSAAVLLCAWLLYQLFPLIPSLSFFAIREQLTLLYSRPAFAPMQALFAWIEWLAIAAITERIFGPRHIRGLMFALLLLLPAKMIFFRRTPGLAEFSGAILAWIVWNHWLRRTPRASVILSWLIVAGLVLQDLAPYRLTHVPQPFSWMPFGGFLESGPEWGGIMLFRKSFWYGSAVWSFHQAGYTFFRTGIAVAVLLGCLEYAQRFLPGRTPEISDAVLALLLTVLMSLLEQRRAISARPMPVRPGDFHSCGNNT